MSETKAVTMRFPPSVVKRLKINAANTGRNVTQIVLEAIAEHLAKPKEKREAAQ